MAEAATATTWTGHYLTSRLTLDVLWRLAVPVIVLCFINLGVVQPNDFWWHIRTGQVILQDGSIPRTDLFSFTRYGKPWVNQAWLMQVWLYLLHWAGGLPLVVFAHAVTVTTGYALLQHALRRQAGPVLAALATFAAAAVGVRNWAVRPQAFSFLAMGLLVFLVEAHRRDRRLIWLAVPLFALWANCHGGFVFGLAYLGLYLAGSVWDSYRAGTLAEERLALSRLALILLTSCAALALTPEGPVGLAEYALGFARSRPTMQANMEFRPLSVRSPDGGALLVALLFVAFGLRRAGQGLQAKRWLPLVAFTAGSFWAWRILPWAGFVLALVLSDLYRAEVTAKAQPRVGRPPVNLGILGLLIGGLICSLPWLRPILRPGGVSDWASVTTPSAATDYLCGEAPAGSRVFQEQGFASYQIWACPQLPVFVDTRMELYPSKHWEEYLAVSRGRFDWAQILDNHRVEYLLLALEAQEHAVRAAEVSSEWSELYRDDRAVVFGRAGPSTG